MSEIRRLIEVMAKLRDPEGGCPWDLEQSFETVAPYTIEEAYEVDDAIQRGDLVALRDELGDLLLQVVFHAQMAREEGALRLQPTWSRRSATKLERRHPHVFGDARIDTGARPDRGVGASTRREERAQDGATERPGRRAAWACRP